MKKIKKKMKFEVKETWVSIADAEKCPACGVPFPASMQHAGGRVFICLACERYFITKDDGFVELE